MSGSLGKPQGSMAPPGLADNIKRQKELEALNQLAGKADQVEKDKEGLREKAREKEIDDLLPKKVNSAYGELAFETFKEIYKDVFDGVSVKEHFALGFLTHDADLPGGGRFQVRTFRRKEADALRGLAPKLSVFDNADVETFNEENTAYNQARLALALVSFDGEDVKITSVPPLRDTEKWFEEPQVKKKIEMINNLPDEIVGFMLGVTQDVSVAYRLAATENLKNQLAPLSRSSA